MTNALTEAVFIAWLKDRSEGGQHVDGLADIAADGPRRERPSAAIPTRYQGRAELLELLADVLARAARRLGHRRCRLRSRPRHRDPAQPRPAGALHLRPGHPPRLREAAGIGACCVPGYGSSPRPVELVPRQRSPGRGRSRPCSARWAAMSVRRRCASALASTSDARAPWRLALRLRPGACRRAHCVMALRKRCGVHTGMFGAVRSSGSLVCRGDNSPRRRGLHLLDSRPRDAFLSAGSVRRRAGKRQKCGYGPDPSRPSPP